MRGCRDVGKTKRIGAAKANSGTRKGDDCTNRNVNGQLCTRPPRQLCRAASIISLVPDTPAEQPTFAEWLERQMQLNGYETPAQLSRKADLPQASLSEWLKQGATGKPSVESCRKLASAMIETRVTTVDVMVAAGLITKAEADEGCSRDRTAALRELSTNLLWRELILRVVAMQTELEQRRAGVPVTGVIEGEMPGVPLGGSLRVAADPDEQPPGTAS